MAFPTKDWRNSPDTSTPLSAGALEDMETRLGGYTDDSSGGIELGYDEITASHTQAVAGNSNIAGLSLTVVTGARPILVRFDANFWQNQDASTFANLELREDGTAICQRINWGTGLYMNPTMSARRNPAAGSHTYTVNLASVTAKTTTIGGSVASPIFIHVIQV